MPTGKRIGVLVACALVLGLSLAWAFLSMRAVMGAGDGAFLIAFAIPLMVVAAMVGMAVAMSLSDLPAVYAVVVGLRATIGEARRWWVVYPVLAGIGVALGLVSFYSLS